VVIIVSPQNKNHHRKVFMSQQSANPKYTPLDIWPLFQDYLSVAVIAGFLAKLSQRFYKRLYDPMVVVWGFLFQRLNSDHTCDAFVSYLNRIRSCGMACSRTMSESTAAYCKARQRLPLVLAQQILQHTAQVQSIHSPSALLWHARPTFLLDGSTLRLKAEQELIDHYGRPSGRLGTSHWPVMRIVGAFDVWSGALRAIAEGAYVQSEVALAASLFVQLPAGSVVVADQLFGIYRILQELVAAQLDVVVRIQAHHLGRWNQPRLQVGEDRQVSWSPSRNDRIAAHLPTPTVAGRLLYVRVIRAGFRPLDVYLFTTLIQTELFPFEDIARLYACRYQVELDLRHVKTTLKMEALDGKSLDIVRKELCFGLAAYNLVRAWMAKAAQRTGCSPLTLSFAYCWRRITDTAHCLALGLIDCLSPSNEAWNDTLLFCLAKCRLPHRHKQRYEPRAIRVKPQPYPFLKGSRNIAREHLLLQLMKC
jgi:small basic protein